MISAEEIKALMADRCVAGINSHIKYVTPEQKAILTLQTLLNQAANLLRTRAEYCAVTGKPLNDMAETLAAITPYLTKEGE